MRHKGDRVLTIKEIRWAWQRLREGHTAIQVAEALNCCISTFRRNLIRVYGKTKPEADEMIPLVYKEER